MNKIYTLILIISLPVNLLAQVQDSSATLQLQAQRIQKPSLQGKFFILPAALVTYGAITAAYGPLKNINQRITHTIALRYPSFNTAVDDYIQYAPAAVALGLPALGIKGKNKSKDQVIIYAMAMGISTVIVQPLKKVTAVMRPDSSAFNSFPSGHTATAFVAAEFLRQEYGHISAWYTVGGYAVATTTGVLRMLNNKHWLADVVAGAGIGIAATRLAYYMHSSIRWKRNFLKQIAFMPYYQNKIIGISFSKTW